MTPEEIYALLVSCNEGQPENRTEAYVDHASNTIWMIIDEGKLVSFQSPHLKFSKMSDEAISSFASLCLAN